ncbi:PAS domain S-box protein [Desulfatiglans anilini]|uniref:PAS domain S-box protein n=1 Tax=Desulfatiglans anilini TaxID=90728 RepID=UPI00040FA82C|nr:PAS domain S-box protein [Desulfatiglans anilini]
MVYDLEQPVRVLLVEDNPADRDLVAEFMETADFPSETDWAPTLDKAFGFLAWKDYDVMLLDLGLPDSQGIETARTMLEFQPGLPIVVLTGQSDHQMAREAIKNGAQDYILKQDLSPEIISRSIRYAIDRQSFENELAAVYENAPVLMLLVDENLRIRRLNKAVAAFGGKAEKALKGLYPGIALRCQHILDDAMICGGTPFCASCHIRRLVLASFETGQGARNVEISLDVSDNGTGHRVHLLVSTSQIQFKNRILALIVLQDISERKRAEKNLKESEERYRLLFETINQGVVYQNAEGRITEANPRAEMILGVTRHEMLSRAPESPEWRVLREDGSIFPISERPAQAALQSGKKVNGVVMSVFNPQKADWIWLKVDAIPVTAPAESTPFQVYSVFEDITEQRAAQEEIKRKTEEINPFFSSSLDLLCIRDMDGCFHRMNPEWEKTLGYSLEELVGIRSLDLVHPDDLERTLETFEELKHQKPIRNFTNRYRRKDGAYRFIEWRSVPHGKWIYSNARDITDRMQLEEQLRQSQKLESVGRLAGGVAHDFNNILSVIVGYGDMVLHNLGPEHPQYNLIKAIYEAGVRGSALTRQLLAFSRKQLLEMKVLDANSVVTGFEKLMRRVLGEDITLNLALTKEPTPVKADDSQLEQVLMNLVVNARDAMRNGGSLLIETALAELNRAYAERKQGVLPGAYVMIAVSDTGTGMDQETMARVFEPFFTTKDQDEGTGLGLATSYGIVKQHGGNIWIYSEVGQGTTVKVYLPLCTEGKSQLEIPVRPGNLPRGSATIMVVEDDPAVRKLVNQALKSKGYEVMAPGDVRQAIQQAAEFPGPLHLVVSDVIMPEMKGPEVYLRIQEHHPEAKILYISGYTQKVITLHGVLKEGIQFLEKPFTVQGLLEKVASVLGMRP